MHAAVMMTPLLIARRADATMLLLLRCMMLRAAIFAAMPCRAAAFFHFAARCVTRR